MPFLSPLLNLSGLDSRGRKIEKLINFLLPSPPSLFTSCSLREPSPKEKEN
jgi:hypothetical protein